LRALLERALGGIDVTMLENTRTLAWSQPLKGAHITPTAHEISGEILELSLSAILAPDRDALERISIAPLFSMMLAGALDKNPEQRALGRQTVPTGSAIDLAALEREPCELHHARLLEAAGLVVTLL
jgi:hypothetical protein